MASHPARNTLNRPHVILCEGPADESFIRKLVATRKIRECSIRNATDHNPIGRSGGITRIGDTLKAFIGWSGFPSVRHILIVADNDESPRANFAVVQSQIRLAGADPSLPNGFPIPTNSRTMIAGPPSVTILMVPNDRDVGNLECLCYAAARSVSAVAAEVEDFALATGATQWSRLSRLGKMKLRSLLAASHEPDPCIGIGNVWKKKPSLIPLSHQSFDDIADQIQTFANLP